MTAFPWTGEQKDVLTSTKRITLVQAGPGSGKTKVFAELVDRRLKAWTHKTGGLAALSFTNVARTEIEDRVCASTVAPHFVGTLDAFFLRFVIMPFGHLAGLPKSGARLIPSPLDQQITDPTVQIGEKLFPPIFQITANAGDEATPQFQYRPSNGMPVQDVPVQRAAAVLKAKQAEWKKRGRVTHSDCTYLASCILKGVHGASVRSIIARRFPVICIDEFQDTGHFLGRAVLALLAEPGIESIVVGDVDQKIFGFSGVSPNLFNDVEKLQDAKRYPLQISQRCPTSVCKVASKLSRSGSNVVPKATAENGRTVLGKHADKLADIDLKILERAFDLAREEKCRDVAVLVRKRDTKRKFLRTTAKNVPPMSAKGVDQLVRSLDGIKEGRGRKAIEIAEALVCRILFDDDRPTDDEIRAAGVEPAVLRRHVRRMLLELIAIKPGETWGGCTARAKGLCDGIATSCNVASYKVRLGARFRTSKEDKPNEVRGADKPVDFKWPDDFERVEVLTIHEAKGREFDAVLFYCPEPRKSGGVSTCPSEAWWAPPADSEEREVAFVAATRAKRLLIVAVHDKTWTALGKAKKDFVDLFEALSAGPAKA